MVSDAPLLVPDTHVFLHGRNFNEVKWGDLLESAELGFAMPIIDELDAWKGKHSDSKLAFEDSWTMWPHPMEMAADSSGLFILECIPGPYPCDIIDCDLPCNPMDCVDPCPPQGAGQQVAFYDNSNSLVWSEVLPGEALTLIHSEDDGFLYVPLTDCTPCLDPSCLIDPCSAETTIAVLDADTGSISSLLTVPYLLTNLVLMDDGSLLGLAEDPCGGIDLPTPCSSLGGPVTELVMFDSGTGSLLDSAFFAGSALTLFAGPDEAFVSLIGFNDCPPGDPSGNGGPPVVAEVLTFDLDDLGSNQELLRPETPVTVMALDQAENDLYLLEPGRNMVTLYDMDTAESESVLDAPNPVLMDWNEDTSTLFVMSGPTWTL